MARDNHIDGLFVKIDVREVDAEAFRTLKPLAWKARTAIAAEFWRSGGVNPMPVSCRTLGDWIGCGPSAAQEALQELVTYGYLVVERSGSLRGSTGGRAVLYRLTWEKTKDGHVPTYDFRRRRKTANPTSAIADRTSGAADRTSALPDVDLIALGGFPAEKLEPCQDVAPVCALPRNLTSAGRNPLSDNLSPTIDSPLSSKRAPAPQLPIPTTTARTA